MTTVRLGKEMNIQETARVSASAMNHHVLVLGTSGSGKTVALKQMEMGIAEEGGSVIVLDYSRTHTDMRNEAVESINVRQEGFPLSLLTPAIGNGGRREDWTEMAQAVLKILAGMERLSPRQRNMLRTAIMEAGRKHRKGENEFAEIYRQIQLASKDDKRLEEAAEGVIEKYYELFNMVKTGVRDVVVPGKVVIIDFSDYDPLTRKALAKLAVGMIWRQARDKGLSSEFPVYLILDEFHALDCRQGSAIEEILREGRKFHLNLIMATQSLASFPREMQAVLSMPATKLYFPMDKKEWRTVAKALPYPTERVEKMERVFWGMDTGTCLAVGKFEVRGSICNQPLTLTFVDGFYGKEGKSSPQAERRV